MLQVFFNRLTLLVIFISILHMFFYLHLFYRMMFIISAIAFFSGFIFILINRYMKSQKTIVSLETNMEAIVFENILTFSGKQKTTSTTPGSIVNIQS